MLKTKNEANKIKSSTGDQSTKTGVAFELDLERLMQSLT